MTDRKTVFGFIVNILLCMDIRKLRLVYTFALALSDTKDSGDPKEILTDMIGIIEAAAQQIKPPNVPKAIREEG